MADRRDTLRALYDRFNARDIEGVLANLHPDVEWVNGWEGGHVHGHEGVRDYWTRQWAQISPQVEPLAFHKESDGQIDVDVRQTVRDLDGEVLSQTDVRHIYAFDGDLIRRMDLA